MTPESTGFQTDPHATAAPPVADPFDTVPGGPSARATSLDTTVPYAATAAPSSLPRIGRYKILSEIARGGMGVVYKAFDSQLDRTVALKLIKSGELADADAIERFHTEAKAAAQLDHPGIVPVYEVGEFQGQHFLTMAFVDGHSLWQEVKESPLAPKRAAKLMQQVAEAIQFAHDRGIVHRDLKPQNILLTKDGQPKVTDFGLAKRREQDGSLTQTGQALGTPSYMPPEQAKGQIKEIGPLADVYSLGATLYCLLTGRPPFQAATQLETMLQVVEQDPVSPKSLNRAVSVDLETICLKCLQKSPSQRYADAKAMSEDLDRYLRDVPILARPIGRIERGWRWCRRNPLATAIGALFAIASITSTLLWVTRPAYLDLRVNPPETRIMVDGREVTLQNGKTLLQFGAGKHVVEAAAQGYETVTQDVLLTRGRDNATVMALDLEVREGHLHIDSIPAGAAVEVLEPNGPVRLRGTTPFHSPPLPTGEYQVKLSQLLYAPQTQTIRVPTGRRVATLPTVTLSPQFEGSESYARFQQRRDRLAKPISTDWNFRGVPFQQAFDFIEKSEDVNVVVMQTAILEDGLNADVSLTLDLQQGISFGSALKLLLDPYQLTFVPVLDSKSLRLEIVPNRKQRARNETVIFPVGDPTIRQQEIMWSPLLQQITSNTSGPWQAQQGIGGSMNVMAREQSLMVVQNWQTLLEVDHLLTEVRAANIARSSAGNRSSAVEERTHGEQARQLQEACAEKFGVPVEYANSLGIKFRLIPPGEFLMGSTPDELSETLTHYKHYEKQGGGNLHWLNCLTSQVPQHRVILTKPIYVGILEVTQKQFEQVLGKNPSSFAASGQFKDRIADLETGEFPVETVTWQEAAEFCLRLSEIEQLQPCYAREGEIISRQPGGTGYRLPTEAEWEYAARGTTTARFWTGAQDEQVFQAGWFIWNSRNRTHRVGELKPNPFGLYDVHGNVYEWVQDTWEMGYYDQLHKQQVAENPEGGKSSMFVVRGGCWHNNAPDGYVFSRYAFDAAARPYDVGFRVVLPVEGVQSSRKIIP